MDAQNRLVDTADKERVKQIERVALRLIHDHVWNRWLVGSCCIARGAQLCVLWWPRRVGWGCGREAQEGGDTCIQIADSLVSQQKQTQHYKAIIHHHHNNNNNNKNNNNKKNQSNFLTPGEVKVVRGLSVRKTNAATFKQAVDRNPDILVGEIQ